MAPRLLSLGKKLLLLVLLFAVVVAGIVVYEVQGWKSDSRRFARAAAVKAGRGELSFSVHFADAKSVQVHEMIRLLHELRLQGRKLRTAENFSARTGWGSRARHFSLPGLKFDRAAGYVRFSIGIEGRPATECYPNLREIVVTYLAAHPDLTGATLRICDDGGVLAEYACREPHPADWPPAELGDAK